MFSIAAGVIHVSAAADHQNLPVMMVGFLVVAVLQVGLGGLLIWRRPDKLLLIAALGLMLGSVGMWLMSRTSGLPFLPGGHMEPIGFKDSVTVLFEIATVPGLLLLMSPDLGGVRLPSARLGTQGLAFLSAGAFLLFVPALMLDGGSHHAAGQAGHPHAGGGGRSPWRVARAEGQTLTADADGHSHGGAGADHHGTARARAAPRRRATATRALPRGQRRRQRRSSRRRTPRRLPAATLTASRVVAQAPAAPAEGPAARPPAAMSTAAAAGPTSTAAPENARA